LLAIIACKSSLRSTVLEGLRSSLVLSTEQNGRTGRKQPTRAIFPKRKIGLLREGYEASFLALEGNPIEDLRNLQRIKVRFKQGVLLELFL
jgi:imidazolonepropionase-like amidohydrolase